MNKIFETFDKWVSQRGNGQYACEADILTPIQQFKDEIVELVDVITRLNLSKSTLEIGLGVFGGTHMLWRMLFDKVITIDSDHNVIEAFKHRESLDEKSILISADSKQVPQSVVREKFCFLHIDGDHTYNGVKSDYLNYSKLVKSGGLIAIHDALMPDIKRFGIDLANGLIDGNKHTINYIIKSNRVGYIYEVVL